jgi:HSP20 family molecular chaperone IbpA
MKTLNKTENQAASTSTTRANYVTPLANIVETRDGYVLEAEMPGVSRDGLEVTVENGDLTIYGRRKSYESPGVLLYGESRGADFRRTFEIDSSINAAGITAKIEQGILTLHLPKAEAVKPRKISVTD